MTPASPPRSGSSQSVRSLRRARKIGSNAMPNSAPTAPTASTAPAAATNADLGAPIHFEIHRVGAVFSAAADQGNPFFVGRQTQFHDKPSGLTLDGLFNVPS